MMIPLSYFLTTTVPLLFLVFELATSSIQGHSSSSRDNFKDYDVDYTGDEVTYDDDGYYVFSAVSGIKEISIEDSQLNKRKFFPN